jgi:hypothetical protein
LLVPKVYILFEFGGRMTKKARNTRAWAGISCLLWVGSSGD